VNPAAEKGQKLPGRRPLLQSGPLARTMTAILILWIGLDIGLRIGPVAWLNTLPQLQLARIPGRFHPFIPSQALVQNPWVGETALAGNLTPTEFRDPVRFSTDELGYRLTPGVTPQTKIEALTFGGDSLSYGGSLSDDETLASVLTRDHGIVTYNAGHFFRDTELLASLDDLLKKLGNQRPEILELFWENNPPAISRLEYRRWQIDGPGERLLGSSEYHRIRQSAQFAKRAVQSWWALSPAEVISTRLIKRISNDRILPNPYLPGVQVRKLPDGRRFVFLQKEVEVAKNPPDDRQLQADITYYSHLSSRLAERGMRMRVLLIPNRYSVYGQVVDGEGAVPSPRYLNRLEAELRQKGIATVNLLRAWQPEANHDAATGNLSYYREDHHWTSEGVRRAARLIAAQMRDVSSKPAAGGLNAVQ